MTQISAAINDAANPFVPRRSHRKSRRGCANCKQRRIKCDETKPACANCLRRRKQCDFLLGPSSVDDRHEDANFTSPSGLDTVDESVEVNGKGGADLTISYASLPQTFLTPEDSFEQQALQKSSQIAGTQLNIQDLELLHHFLTRTCHEFAVDDKDSSEIWQNKFPKIGFANPYAMHMMLALSALHLGRCNPQRLPSCQEQADTHYSMALPAVIDLVHRLDADNCEPLLVASILICFFHFAKGPKPGQYIAFSDEGECEWFPLLRGVRSINVCMSQIKATAESDESDKTTQGTKVRTIDGGLDFQPHLDRLRHQIESLPAGHSDLHVSLTALSELEQIFVARYTDSLNRNNGPQQSHSQFVFAWLYRVADTYVAGLQRKSPASLAVFAHWAVLLRDIECTWLFEGWQEHVLRGVMAWIPAELRDMIAWPLHVAGMEPD